MQQSSQMEKRSVLLPQPIVQDAVRVLETAGVKIVKPKDTREQTLHPLIKEAEAIVLRTGVKINHELLESAENLLTISRTGAGVDNIDLDAATEKGIIVSSSVGINTVSVVEHTIALMLCLFKQLLLMDREVRRGNFMIRYKNYPHDLRKKTLGVLGFGRIGSLLAQKCSSMLEMEILAYDPYLSKELKSNYKGWVEFVALQKLFEKSDVVSIHIPLTESTKEMIDMSLLKSMKKQALLINTSRGGVIKESDLIEALAKKIIAGAGLDVFKEEPLDPSNPLLRLDNVILTPHTAALTAECVVEMAVCAVKRILDVFNGYVPSNVANPEVLSLSKWKNLKWRGSEK